MSTTTTTNKPLLDDVIHAIDLYVVIHDDYKPLNGKPSSVIQSDGNGRYVIHHVKHIQSGFFPAVLSTGAYNIEFVGQSSSIHAGRLILYEKTLVEHYAPRKMEVDVLAVILILAVFYYIVS